jgi:hypothetical protein
MPMSGHCPLKHTQHWSLCQLFGRAQSGRHTEKKLKTLQYVHDDILLVLRPLLEVELRVSGLI